MSNAFRTVDEYIALYAIKNHKTPEEVKDCAAVRNFMQYAAGRDNCDYMDFSGKTVTKNSYGC